MFNGNIDLQWDMLNSLCGPKADRAISIIPYVGLGVAYTWGFNGDIAMIPTDQRPSSQDEGSDPSRGSRPAAPSASVRLCRLLR